MELAILYKLLNIILISAALGTLIGLEREMSQKHFKIRRFAGIRTFILITLFGTLSAFLAEKYSDWFLIISFLGFFLFIISSYVVASARFKETGSTTEFAAILAFIIGVMCYQQYFKISIILAILVTILLSIKIISHKFAKTMKREEFYAALKFGIIAFVLLPLLPNKIYGPYDVFNPYIIWLMVVFISSISFVGYILVKFIGQKRGIGLTGFLGGLVSSTAVTMSFSERSKKSRIDNPLVLGTLVASATKFLRVLFVVFVLNRALLDSLILPLVVMFVVSFIISYVFYRMPSKDLKHKIELESPFALAPALKFGAFFVAILYISKISLTYFAEKGIYATALFSGIADVDAITVTMSQLGGTDILLSVAAIAIMLSVFINLIIKAAIGYMFGSRSFAHKLGLATLIIIISGILPLFLF